MNNSTQLIEKVHLEQASGFIEISVYKKYFIKEVKRGNKALEFPVSVNEIKNPFKHHDN